MGENFKIKFLSNSLGENFQPSPAASVKSVPRHPRGENFHHLPRLLHSKILDEYDIFFLPTISRSVTTV